MKRITQFLLFALLPLVAYAQHSATVTGMASPSSTVAGYHIYRGATSSNLTKITTSPLPTVNYTDSIVNAGATYYYAATAVDSGGTEGAFSNIVMAVIPGAPPPPPPPPPQSGVKVGDRIKVNSTANIRSTAPDNGFGPLIGSAPTNSLGTVTIVTSARIPNTTSAVWIQVDFDTASLPTGYMGSDNMTVVTTPPPPPPSPTLTESCSIVSGKAVCTYTYANFPSGTVLTSAGTAGSVNAQASVTLP